VVSGHLETLLADAQERHPYGYPSHIEKTYRAYLDCGLLSRGFARVVCQVCGKENLVAFSCKKRGVCPSCEGRRMAEVAAHLVDRVLPKAAYRQWTLSVPHELRLPMAANPSVLSDVLRRFIQEVFTYKRRRARAHGVLDPKPGAITFVQRFGSILNLHPHFHTSIPDGVFAQDEAGRARWVPLDGPSKQDIEHLAHRVSIRVRRYFEQEHACEMAGGAQDDGDLQTLAEAIKRPGLPAQDRSPAARVRA